MTDKVQKIRQEVVRMHNLLPVVDGDNIYVNYADRICTTLEMYIDSLQKEPTSKQNLSNVQRTGKNCKEPTSWLDEFRAKLDSLSKEEFEQVWKKYGVEEKEEPVSDDLEEYSTLIADELPQGTALTSNGEFNIASVRKLIIDACKYGAKWQKKQDQSTIELAEDHAMFAGMEKMKEEMMKDIWKHADGEDLPEIDREVIAILDYDFGHYKVVYAHRPNPEGWNGTNIDTGEKEHFEPATYGKGGWNQPHVLYWLDARMPYEEK